MFGRRIFSAGVLEIIASVASAGILYQSMEARNRVGIGLSYRSDHRWYF
jgi:hypothetical protein